MEFKKGEYVIDLTYNEVFKYVAKRDKYAVLSDPHRFRHATEDEIKEYENN